MRDDPARDDPIRRDTGTVDLGALFQRLRRPLYNYFRRCGLPGASSEDLTQGVFLHLLEQPNRFDPARGRVEVYLFGVARNLRRNRERSDRLRTGESMPDELCWTGPEPSEVTAVRQAVGALTEERREAIVLREFHGLSYDEIAQVQQVPVGTVRSRLARAREELKRRLTKEAEECDR